MAISESPPSEDIPAARLEGRVLPNGWTVGKRISHDHPEASGGNFSVCYHVFHRDGRQAFLKALNFRAALLPGTDMIDKIVAFTKAYQFERDLLKMLGERRLSHIIRLIDAGQIDVPETRHNLPRVPYLITELADGDIRAFKARNRELDCAWAFRVMKHVLLGLEQMHTNQCAHQDIKPSNVLTQNLGSIMKLGDVGRAERLGFEGPASGLIYPGDRTYAPPEQLYRVFGLEWEERKASDLYLAGSLGVFLFLNHNMTPLLRAGLPVEFRPGTWEGSFDDVLPALQHVHSEILANLEEEVLARTSNPKWAENFTTAIGYMTHPSPALRGHPRDRAAKSSSYAVRRFISGMEVLSQEAYYNALGVTEHGRPF